MQIDLSPSSNNTIPKFTQWIQHLQRNWFNFLILFLVLHVLFNKNISVSFSINSKEAIAQEIRHQASMNFFPSSEQSFIAQPASYEEERRAPKQKTAQGKKPPKKKKWSSRKANTFSNLTFVLSPDYGERHNVHPDIVQEKIGNCKTYVKRYLEVAKVEKEKYGIPVSITLAQGLLESNAGESRLSVESNNHFGIKCRSKCKGCTCRNYTDDDIYDMFRVFDSVWESYREHSKLLQGKRYRHLLKVPAHDYKSWSHGLKKAGYATDKRYAEKLIKIIEELNLNRYDA